MYMKGYIRIVGQITVDLMDSWLTNEALMILEKILDADFVPGSLLELCKTKILVKNCKILQYVQLMVVSGFQPSNSYSFRMC